MDHAKTDFEVISTTDSDSEHPSEEYSQTDRSFMLDLYRENRELISSNAEKQVLIEKLKVRNEYLKNSNLYWMVCYVGTVLSTLFSLTR